MRTTRKAIAEAVKFLPHSYIIQHYNHGFEVICLRKGMKSSVFFYEDGTALRTDIRADLAKRMTITRAATVLGLL